MRFICTQENLLRGLINTTSLAGKNNQLPILSHALCQVKEGVLHLTCTDLEIGVHTTVAGKAESEGGCTVPARKLLEYVQNIPSNNPVYIERQQGYVLVTTVGFSARFPALETDDFPLLPTVTPNSTVIVPGALLVEALSNTVFAAAREKTRPEIRSVLVVGEGMQLRLAATDSFRLAEQIVPLDKPVADFSLLLPLVTAQEVIRLFGEQKELTILPQENYVVFRSGASELSSRLMEGVYPDYQQIIPTSHSRYGTVEREQLSRALKTLSVFLPRDSRRIHITVKPTDEVMILKVAGNETGESEVVIGFKGEGEVVEVFFNSAYILEGVARLKTRRCVWKMGDATQPALLEADQGGGGYRYVVMPIQA